MNMAITHTSRAAYADQTNCASPSSENKKSGPGAPSRCEGCAAFQLKEKATQSILSAGANTPASFISARVRVNYKLNISTLLQMPVCVFSLLYFIFIAFMTVYNPSQDKEHN